MWWPHPDDLLDLVVDTTKEGWELSAPAGTPCADWINYYGQTPELEEEFRREFTQTIINHAQFVIHGQTEVPGHPETRPSEEKDPSRERAIHETLCDI